MPHTPEHIASTTLPANMPLPKSLPRPGESIETTRARLVYQSRKRGTLESDLLLSTFAQEHLGAMNAEELSEFDKVRSSVLVLVSGQDKRVLYSSESESEVLLS
jgi:succinate dehydrogenase assembly factor 2